MVFLIGARLLAEHQRRKYQLRHHVPVGKFRWITVVSPDEQDGTELSVTILRRHFNSFALENDHSLRVVGFLTLYDNGSEIRCKSLIAWRAAILQDDPTFQWPLVPFPSQ